MALASHKSLHPMTTTAANGDLSTGEHVTTPHQRSYSDADYQTAYHVWAGPAGRSNRRTSALLGIPPATVNLWAIRFNWQERYDEANLGRLGSAARESDRVVQELIIAGQVPAIVALHEIVADPGHKRRDVAALALLALGGRPLPKAPTITATKTLGDGSTISVKASDLSHLSPEQLTTFARTGELPEPVSDSDA